MSATKRPETPSGNDEVPQEVHNEREPGEDQKEDETTENDESKLVEPGVPDSPLPSVHSDGVFLPAILGPPLSSNGVERKVYMKPKTPVIVPKKSCPEDTRSCCRSSPIVRFVVSLLMTVCVISYGVGGAFLFSHLENRRDIMFSEKVDRYKNDTAILLATELRQVSPYEDVWAKKVFQYLEIFEKDLLKASAMGYRMYGDPERGRSWTLYNSLYFSFSLMTTAGFGQNMPRSKWSHAIVMGYSLGGITLLFTWLVFLGRSMALSWCWLFRRLCCNACNGNDLRIYPESQTTKNVRISSVSPSAFIGIGSESSALVGSTGGFGASTADCLVAIFFPFLLLIVYFIIGSAVISLLNHWSVSDSFYLNFAMFVTLGPWCTEAKTEQISTYVLQNPFYISYWLFGMCLSSMVLNLVYMHRCRKK